MRWTMIGALAMVGYTAQAQEGVDGHGFPFAAGDGDLHDLMTTWRPEVQTKGAVGFDALFEFADDTVLLATENAAGDTELTPIVDSLFGLNLGVHAGVHERVAIAASMPLFFTSTGPDGGQGVGAGDLRLSAPIGLLLAEQGSGKFGLSIVPFLTLPTGAAGKNLGNGGFAGGFLVPAGLSFEKLGLTANVGVAGMPGPREDALNLTGGPKLLAALGASYAFHELWAVRGEMRLNPALQSNEVPWSQSPGEAQLSVRHRMETGLSFTGGTAVGLTRGVGTAAWRAFLGATYAIGKVEKVKDTDGDGIVDKLDLCPSAPEVFNGWKDDDGCPDALADLTISVLDEEGKPLAGAEVFDGDDGSLLGVSDSDGKLAITGRMPESTALLEAKALGQKQPAASSFALAEGNNDVVLQLVWLPGRVRVKVTGPDGAVQGAKVAFQGPTQRDGGVVPDGDHVFFLGQGSWEVLVSADGLGAERRTVAIEPDKTSTVEVAFTLKKAKVTVSAVAVELNEQVFFDSGKATIKTESFALLDEVANTLQIYNQIKKLELAGHTDSQGGAASNLTLSQKRVDSVKAYLVEKGVAPSRLVAVGYGLTKPIADNKTAAGRAKNRRVEIQILEQETVISQ